jgi:hypothetical protein
MWKKILQEKAGSLFDHKNRNDKEVAELECISTLRGSPKMLLPPSARGPGH